MNQTEKMHKDSAIMKLRLRFNGTDQGRYLFSPEEDGPKFAESGRWEDALMTPGASEVAELWRRGKAAAKLGGPAGDLQGAPPAAAGGPQEEEKREEAAARAGSEPGDAGVAPPAAAGGPQEEEEAPNAAEEEDAQDGGKKGFQVDEGAVEGLATEGPLTKSDGRRTVSGALMEEAGTQASEGSGLVGTGMPSGQVESGDDATAASARIGSAPKPPVLRQAGWREMGSALDP